MTLYCISLFLKDERTEAFLKKCKNKKIEYKALVITDQTDERIDGYQVNLFGLKILLLPCNNFHKDRDFEIGITEENQECWNNFIQKAKIEFQNECGKFKDGETEYFIIKDEKLHGNFFFIFDGQKSDEKTLLQLECRMNNYDFDFFEKRISKIVETHILSKINVHKDTCFAIDKIIAKSANEDIIFDI